MSGTTAGHMRARSQLANTMRNVERLATLAPLTDNVPLAAYCMMRSLQEHNVDFDTFDAIVSFSLTGVPFAKELARLLNKKHVRIDGNDVRINIAKQNWNLTRRVVMVNDLALEGSLEHEAAEDLLHNGIETAAIVVLLDYERGAREMLGSWNYSLVSVFMLTELLRMSAEKKSPSILLPCQ